ncbi:hypothetical protein ANCCEY_13179 [Ancylostoma ceylanicum]|uniref:Uncharacterized protein n=1 Tax=Ancylostoma ceylanicum TaxID=53326 RepID=A0A0D6LJC6_9BILA|nr:hypothetical protein ANCCEY_13179 [Ancylostoma ceylanicum]
MPKYYALNKYKTGNEMRRHSSRAAPAQNAAAHGAVAADLLAEVMNCETKHALHCAALLAWILGFAYFCGVFTEPRSAVTLSPFERKAPENKMFFGGWRRT